MFEIVSPDLEVDFVSAQSFFGIISGFLIFASIALLALKGPNYGIDFKGGTDMILQFKENVSTADIRDAADAMGLEVDRVQRYGSKGEDRFLVQSSEVSVMSARRVNNDIVPALNTLGNLKEQNWSAEQPNRMMVEFSDEKETDTIVSALEKAGLESVSVRETGVGSVHSYEIEFQDLRQRIQNGFANQFPDAFEKGEGVQRLETVGARAGEQLRNDGILSLVVALMFILIYIGFRFDLRYAPGAVAALVHDITLAIGFFTLTGLEISLPIIAALLTIIGYSLNDTIVVFDRIRENTELSPGVDLSKLVNQSLNETLSRTLVTSITTLLAVVAIAVLGGGLIRNFAIALIVGVIVGTYSSVFVASPFVLKMNDFIQRKKETDDILDSKTSSAV